MYNEGNKTLYVYLTVKNTDGYNPTGLSFLSRFKNKTLAPNLYHHIDLYEGLGQLAPSNFEDNDIDTWMGKRGYICRTTRMNSTGLNSNVFSKYNPTSGGSLLESTNRNFHVTGYSSVEQQGKPSDATEDDDQMQKNIAASIASSTIIPVAEPPRDTTAVNQQSEYIKTTAQPDNGKKYQWQHTFFFISGIVATVIALKWFLKRA